MREKVKKNYDLMMQETLKEHVGSSLLLHACCAPCSSSVLLRLSQFFKITIFYYNPNIDTVEEYKKREEELKKLTLTYNERSISPWPISLLVSEYEPKEFEEIARGFEDCSEGGHRCHKCYAMRLLRTYEMAKKMKNNFFCSTLSVSPYKNATILNETGFSIANSPLSSPSLISESPLYLPNDFKKRDGYLTSIKMSRELGLYRQDYCGCKYSKIATDNISCKENLS